MPSTKSAHIDQNKSNFKLWNAVKIAALAMALLLLPGQGQAIQISGWKQSLSSEKHNNEGSIITESVEIHDIFGLTNNASKSRFELIIQCAAGSLNLVISHSKPFYEDVGAISVFNRYFSHFDKIYRIPVYLDDQPGRIFKFYENTIQTGIGLWGREQSEPFIERIIHAKKMRIMSLLPRVTPTFIDFDITGIKEAIAPLLKSCEK